ncbi:MAG: hypothetical protein KatS3mg103_1268 [Phycisphaerales bacterium]|nr:MAG: hypothetical protein KatS3mg103_1268 [Phycisphaerales bacterium]
MTWSVPWLASARKVAPSEVFGPAAPFAGVSLVPGWPIGASGRSPCARPSGGVRGCARVWCGACWGVPAVANEAGGPQERPSAWLWGPMPAQRAREDSNLRPTVSASPRLSPRTGPSLHPPPRHAGRWWGGCRALPAAALVRRRCGGIAGAAHPLVSTPSADCDVPSRPVGGSARDCPSPTGWPAARVSPSSPGSPRLVSKPGPSLRRKPSLYPAELRALAGIVPDSVPGCPDQRMPQVACLCKASVPTRRQITRRRTVGAYLCPFPPGVCVRGRPALGRRPAGSQPGSSEGTRSWMQASSGFPTSASPPCSTP